MDAGNFPAGLRVLAVDDDRVSLKILEKQLNHCNYTVTTVTDGKKALDMLRERKDGHQFNLVISDVVMPGIDGFKLLELIGLEMDIPVIMLSANNETEIMMKGINHGACDYLVKPVRLEQLRGIWMHMVRNNKTDPRNSSSSGGNNFANQKLQSEDGDKGDKNGANRSRKYSKNKKDVGGADEDKENTSTQKRQRVHWPGDLHRKFVQAVNQIGMDRAVPKKILEAMNVEGLSRENVASHLQKYRIYLRKLSEGKLKNPNPFVDGPKAWWSDWVPANISMTVPESFKHHSEVGRYQSVPSFVDSPSSSNLYARMNSPSAVETHNVLSIQSDQPMNSQSNLGIPRQDMDVMEPIGHSCTLPKGTVPMPLQDVSKFMLSGWLSGASQCFPSGPSGSSLANTSNGVVYNTSNPPSLGISGSSFANISNDSPPLATSMQFYPSRSCTSYASLLRGKILGSSKGIPFEDIADGEMLVPSDDLPMQSPELVNQRSVQIQSSSNLFNQVAREAHQFPRLSDSWKADELSRCPELDHDVRMSKRPSQGNIIKINQLSRLAASCGQVQIAGIMGRTTSMIGVTDQVPQFNFGSNTHYTAVPISDSNPGSSASTRPSLPNLQLDNYVMATPIQNDGGASGNLPEDGTNQQAVGDQVTNSDEFLVGTSNPQNGASGDLDEIFADWFNDDFINSGDTFTGGDWEFAT